MGCSKTVDNFSTKEALENTRQMELKNAHINRLFCYYKLRFVCGEL